MITPKIDNPDAQFQPKIKSLEIRPNLRDQTWLEIQLEEIWSRHFTDVTRLNSVVIRWSRSSRTRLGTITTKGAHYPWEKPKISEIKINPLLQDETVPMSVVWQTIAHELAHYTHGFCSPHPRKFAHPHRGNIIKKELYQRNMGTVYDEAEQWLKQTWPQHVIQHVGPKKRTRRRYARRHLSVLSHLKTAFASRHSRGNR